MKLKSAFDWLAKKLGELAGTITSAYRKSVEESNAQFRAQAKDNAYEQKKAERYDDYMTIAEIVAGAINNTNEATYLSTVSTAKDIMCNPWLHQRKDGVCFFKLRAICKRSSGITAGELERILQDEVTRLCGIWNLPSLTVRISVYSQGLVKIIVAITSELRANQKIVI